MEEKPDTRFYFTVPFDPHEIQYWLHSPFMRTLYITAILRAEIIDGIRVDEEDEVTWFYQTHRDFDCEVLNES
jgi:hypothetical protein